MRKSNLFLGLLLLAVSCGPGKTPKTLLSKLERNSTIDADRKVANSTSDYRLTGSIIDIGITASGCFKDKFTVDTLKSEIAILEKRQGLGTKVVGKWKHLNLSDLPIPQANFLKTYDKKFGDLTNQTNIDYSSCQDLPCIFNKIYGNENNIAGYVHYLWYLKMGHMLSLDNQVRDGTPGVYNGTSFPLSKYLYNEKELYAWWRLTRMLKAPYTEIGHMDQIQRIPRGEEFEDVRAKRLAWEARNRIHKEKGEELEPADFVNACGYAHSDGYIQLNDGCLTVYADYNTGHAFDAITHELAHEIDFYQGRTLYKSSYRSHQIDYVTVSGIQRYEYKNEKGELVSAYKTLPGKKVISIYALTNFQENFAETLAYFRTSGEQAKENLTTEHRDWTARNYYAGEYYDPQSLYQRWIDGNSSELAQRSFKTVSDCSKATTSNVNTYFKKSDFSVPVLPSMVNCLGAEAEKMSQYLVNGIKSEDPQGCQQVGIEYKRIEFVKALQVVQVKIINKYLEELAKDKTYFAKVQQFYDELPDRTMAGNAYVQCYADKDPEACYIEETAKLALARVAPLNLPETHANDLVNLYIEYHKYESIKEHVDALYRSFVASHGEIIFNGALELFKSCEGIGADDTQPPTGRNFSVGDGYMISSHFNCLNASFPDTAKDIVRDLSAENQKVQHANEEIILLNEVRPLLQKKLLDIYKDKSADELTKINSIVPDEAKKIRGELLANFSWVKDVVNTEATQVECERKALMYVPLTPKYNMKSKVYAQFMNLVCKDITLSSEYNDWIESSLGDFQSKAYANLESKVLTFATWKAKECLKQFPVDTQLNRVRYKQDREDCVVSEWYKFESSAFDEFKKDPLVIKFKIDQLPLQGRLESERRRLQIKIFKEHFQ